MCIVCKLRDVQSNLVRLQYKDKAVVNFTGSGRSFYVCKNCINNKNLLKHFSRVCKTKIENQILKFKEFKGEIS